MPRVTIALLKDDKTQYRDIRFKLEGVRTAASYVRNAEVGLVVAPEYFFRDPNQNDLKNYHVSRDEKTRIQDSLLDVSRDFPNVVLAPGTVAWKQPTSDRPRFVSEVALKGSSQGYFDHSVGMTALNKSVSMSLTALTQSGNPLFALGPPPVSHLLYNTLYLYHDGHYWGLDKQGDFHESSSDKVLVYEHGAMLQELRVNGYRLRFGLEICLDHVNGRLAQHLQGTGEGPVDLHVIMSDFAFNKAQHFCARDGGAVVHASTKERAVEISKRYIEVDHPSGGTQVLDTKKGALRPFKPSLGPQSSVAPTNVGGFWVRPLLHNKRVTNVFQNVGGTYVNQRVEHQLGEYFTLTGVNLR
ncbi:hypothetical protein D7X74_11540 [Corallococcus sp. CA047B]|uniref:hypothetical protein n=1 Tax=Corallococcus sp. CA047B TaxID=2316729 RepID=UPI000EA05FBF|nr:hypothetical protein [Corallococcus sp. CA047B]RKH17702.1 hypothetical protein D7X74_11540 [Corallococcus sp. CA047B]